MAGQKIQVTLDGATLKARHYASAAFRAGLPAAVVHDDIVIPDDLRRRLEANLAELLALNADRMNEWALDAAAQHRVSTGTNRKELRSEIG